MTHKLIPDNYNSLNDVCKHILSFKDEDFFDFFFFLQTAFRKQYNKDVKKGYKQLSRYGHSLVCTLEKIHNREKTSTEKNRDFAFDVAYLRYDSIITILQNVNKRKSVDLNKVIQILKKMWDISKKYMKI